MNNNLIDPDIAAQTVEQIERLERQVESAGAAIDAVVEELEDRARFANAKIEAAADFAHARVHANDDSVWGVRLGLAALWVAGLALGVSLGVLWN